MTLAEKSLAAPGCRTRVSIAAPGFSAPYRQALPTEPHSAPHLDHLALGVVGIPGGGMKGCARGIVAGFLSRACYLRSTKLSRTH